MELSIYLAVSALVLGSQAQRYTGGWGDFYYPDEEGLQFWRGDTINVTYGCNYTEPALFMVCGSFDPNAKDTGGYRFDDIFIDIVPPRENYYVFEMNKTLTPEDTECWFDMRRNRSDEYQKGDSFASLPFGVWMVPKGEQTRRESQSEPTSTDALQSTSTSRSETVTTEAATSVATTAAALNNGDEGQSGDSSGDEGLSTGAQTGIGVGVAMGGLGLIAAGIAFWLLRRRRKMSDKDDSSSTTKDDASGHVEGGFVKPKAELDGDTCRAELDGVRPAAEMASTDTKKFPGTEGVAEMEARDLAEMESPTEATEMDSPATPAMTVSPQSPENAKPHMPLAELPG